ncbi:hypothetical protein OKA05_06305 [Luteolibacter arcticus]|uniref:Uncharacterized protein n=1 Tax=Luteolibacter arcticus TaxID=1581411 RepID=A0ABT3GEX0_9BACT|nr:hypothetical protein [Luteolibacter arcticus]MCW1922156.1 hypothetical protein [Luteolibacter arcticus]
MNRIVISCLLATAFGASAIAQQPGRPRVVPAPPNFNQPGQVQGGQEPAESLLPFNVKLHLEGSVFGAVTTDQSITTGGRDVVADLELGVAEEQPMIGTFQAVLTPGDPWQAVISLGVRSPIRSKSGNVEYRDLVLRTTVRIAPGKKVVLWQKGDQKLTLSMDQEKE